MEMYVSPKDPQIEKILFACGWETKRPISLYEFHGDMQISNNFWDSGNKDVWRAVNLFDMRTTDFPTQEFLGRIQKIADIPDGVVLVCYQHRGQNSFITIHAKGITKFLPAANETEISEDMKKFLFLSGIISSYRKKYYSDWHWNDAKVEAIKAEALKLGFITKNGAFTIEGKNRKLALEKEGYRVYGF